MWFLKKTQPKIICFFCKIEVAKDVSYELEYKASDGEGKVIICPMCAGMLDDMNQYVKDIYNE